MPAERASEGATRRRASRPTRAEMAREISSTISTQNGRTKRTVKGRKRA